MRHDRTTSQTVKAMLMSSLALALAACQESESIENARAFHPIPAATLDLMAKSGTTEASPMLIRTFKKESELEVWKKGQDGRYVFIKTFPMCRWSGQLGPKTHEGDRQVPEGFYTIAPGQMNPNSHYYLSFNVGYPNAYDRAHNFTGSEIMVHGICSSAGCFSMTNEQIDEIYALAREAFGGGQREIQMESFPFRMTPENMAKFRFDKNMPFWRQIKVGYDYFETTREEPKVAACDARYVFGKTPANPTDKVDAALPCPALKDADPSQAAAVAAKEKADDQQTAALVASGAPAVRLVYQDGGQNPEFADKVTEVSRPEALAAAPMEIAMIAPGRDAPPPKVAPITPAKVPAAIMTASAAATPRQSATPPRKDALPAPASTAVTDTKAANLFASSSPGPTAPTAQGQTSQARVSETAAAAPSNDPHAPATRGKHAKDNRPVQTAALAPQPAPPAPPPSDQPFYKKLISAVSDKLPPFNPFGP